MIWKPVQAFSQESQYFLFYVNKYTFPLTLTRAEEK